MILPTFFFFKIVLANLVLLPIHINFRIKLSISTKNYAGICIRFALNLELNLERADIFILSPYFESSGL